MIPKYCDDPRLSQVRASQARAYLLDRGWAEQPHPRPELWVFGGKDDDDGLPILQVLPSADSASDYLMRLEELVHAMSVLEERPQADVLTDMLKYPGPAGSKNGTPNTRPRRPRGKAEK